MAPLGSGVPPSTEPKNLVPQARVQVFESVFKLLLTWVTGEFQFLDQASRGTQDGTVPRIRWVDCLTVTAGTAELGRLESRWS